MEVSAKLNIGRENQCTAKYYEHTQKYYKTTKGPINPIVYYTPMHKEHIFKSFGCGKN